MLWRQTGVEPSSEPIMIQFIWSMETLLICCFNSYSAYMFYVMWDVYFSYIYIHIGIDDVIHDLYVL